MQNNINADLLGRRYPNFVMSSYKRTFSHAYRVSPISRYQFNSKVDEGTFVKETSDRISRIEKRYLGRNFWAIGFGFCSTGNITDEMVNEYLEYHRNPNDNKYENFIIEE